MSDARERLTSLVELATENAPEKRRKLAIELCDLLLDWPPAYPAAMREPFETLLEKTVRLVDRDTREALIGRIAAAPGAPLDFLNEFFFDAPGELRGAILGRNAEAPAAPDGDAVDEAALIAEMRGHSRDGFADALALALGLTAETTARILHDGSGETLAIAAKGAHLSRAAFSTLALLCDGAGSPQNTLARLSAYEAVPQRGAESLLCFWRSHRANRASHAA
jgi:hypothetical protein